MKQSDFKLVLTPDVWARICYCRDEANTEVGFMGIASDPDNPLRIDRVYMPKQECSAAYVEFDETSLSDHVEALAIEEQLQPFQTCRVWFHTHPGNCAKPSSTDESTFKDFCQGDFAVMAIVAMDGSTTCRLSVNHRMGNMAFEIPIIIDYAQEFRGTDFSKWKEVMNQMCESRSYTVGYQGYNAKKPYQKHSSLPGTNITGYHGWDEWDAYDGAYGGYNNSAAMQNEKKEVVQKAKKRKSEASDETETSIDAVEEVEVIEAEEEVSPETLFRQAADQAARINEAYAAAKVIGPMLQKAHIVANSLSFFPHANNEELQLAVQVARTTGHKHIESYALYWLGLKEQDDQLEQEFQEQLLREEYESDTQTRQMIESIQEKVTNAN